MSFDHDDADVSDILRTELLPCYAGETAYIDAINTINSIR